MCGRATIFLYAHPSVPAATLKEFIEHARANPGKLVYGTGNPLSILYNVQLMNSTGISMLHVPYKGEGPLMPDIIAGRLHSSFLSQGNAISLAKEGKLRALAVLLDKRSLLLPEVPTIAEAGAPAVTVRQWAGVFGPPKLPRDIVERLNKEGNAALKRPDVLEQLQRYGYAAEGPTPEGRTPINPHGLAAGATALVLAETGVLAAAVALLLPAGRLADASDKAMLYKVGMVTFALSSLLVGLVSSVPAILCLRFVQGITSAAVQAAGPAIIADAVPPERRGRAYGITIGASYAGLTLGPIWPGFLVHLCGWRAGARPRAPRGVRALAAARGAAAPQRRSADEEHRAARGAVSAVAPVLQRLRLGVHAEPVHADRARPFGEHRGAGPRHRHPPH